MKNLILFLLLFPAFAVAHATVPAVYNADGTMEYLNVSGCIVNASGYVRNSNNYSVGVELVIGDQVVFRQDQKYASYEWKAEFLKENGFYNLDLFVLENGARRQEDYRWLYITNCEKLPEPAISPMVEVETPAPIVEKTEFIEEPSPVIEPVEPTPVFVSPKPKDPETPKEEIIKIEQPTQEQISILSKILSLIQEILNKMMSLINLEI